MSHNYFKIGWRNLKKNKLYSFVNIIGLTIGIASCILIGLYVGDELSYDNFHRNKDRIARITMEYSLGGTVGKYATTGTKVGPQLKRSFPSIEAFVRVFKFPRVVSYQEKTFNEQHFLFADSSFFRIFSFRLARGKASEILIAPKQIVITESMAKKYFGKEDPVGKTLRISNSDDFTVTGIAEDPPSNSQLIFDFIASFSSLDASKTEEWRTANYITYFLLNDPGQLPALQHGVTQFMKRRQLRMETGVEGSDYLTYNLEPLNKVHLYSSLDGTEPNGNITYIYILGAIAALILLVACVNYTNLATAQSAARSGEISIRKVLGAHPRQLFGQYLGESVLLSFIAMLFAIGICVELLPLFNHLTEKSLSASLLFHPLQVFSLLALGITVSLLAGAYPAFILSNAKLMSILKSGFRFSASGGTLRKSLIVFQFVISVFLMISTIIILQQLSFIQHKKLGYDIDHIIVLPVDYQMHQDYDAIKKEISLNQKVISVGGAYGKPTFVQWGDDIKTDNGSGTKNLPVFAIPADLDFIKTMNIQIVAGTGFTPADMKQMDTSGNYRNFRFSFILNETGAKALGWKPSEAIGKIIDKGYPGIVKAVVKDFHIASLHQPISPLLIFLDTEYTNNLFVRISGNDIPGTLNFLQKVWKERVPYRPFEYRFLDEDYNALYKTESRTAQLFSAFSTIAITLACLGLFAMAAFTTLQRTKEIGIRKVLGASIINITGLLSKDFLQLVAIAAILAFPISWFAMNKWLEDFAYRIRMSWMVFAGAALLAILIALATVSYQAIKTAITNPVKSLRTE
jgi:putative ABC transport system permease protein